MWDTKRYENITLLVAHPDDEILFCWPFLKAAKRIVSCVSDENDPNRAWCSKRKHALAEVAQLVGADHVNLGADSEFFRRIPARGGPLKAFLQRVMAELSGTVATHNPWGEYGHIDHILCHHAARVSGLPVLTTGIGQEVDWLPIRAYSPGAPIGSARLDMELFEQCKAIYDKYGCWTWSLPPVTECEVYEC